ncbi:unnamed protein product [Toxocara canis]|uniref:Uncharacterized protein n=1 Tax=Toxocara canis TaxID=6265 RepID=A0A183V6N8_TOXCA|nr:unnamed protein product [Toxocara canis]
MKPSLNDSPSMLDAATLRSGLDSPSPGTIRELSAETKNESEVEGGIGLNAESAPPPERGDGDNEGRGTDVGETRRRVATGRGGTPETSMSK